MPVKIRLMRIGAKKRPFYRVVAVDERSKRTGAYIELLGTYNPLTTPHEIDLKKDRIEHWLSQGAVPSVGYLRIIGEAPKRAPRKPKKEKREGPIASSPPAETITEPSEPIKESSQPITEQGTSQTDESDSHQGPEKQASSAAGDVPTLPSEPNSPVAIEEKSQDA